MVFFIPILSASCLIAGVHASDFDETVLTTYSAVQGMTERLDAWPASSGLDGASTIQDEFDHVSACFKTLADQSHTVDVNDINVPSLQELLNEYSTFLDALKFKSEDLKNAGASDVIDKDIKELNTPSVSILDDLSATISKDESKWSEISSDFTNVEHKLISTNKEFGLPPLEFAPLPSTSSSTDKDHSSSSHSSDSTATSATSESSTKSEESSSSTASSSKTSEASSAAETSSVSSTKTRTRKHRSKTTASTSSKSDSSETSRATNEPENKSEESSKTSTSESKTEQSSSTESETVDSTQHATHSTNESSAKVTTSQEVESLTTSKPVTSTTSVASSRSTASGSEGSAMSPRMRNSAATLGTVSVAGLTAALFI